MKYVKIGDIWKQQYGQKIYKLSLSTGCTCPNRDGTKGSGGCIYCSNQGSGDFAQSHTQGILQQIENAKKLVNKKGAQKYIAYFQSFSNTYASVNYLEPIFTQAIKHPDVVELYIATRCDCINSDILGMLSRLQQIKPVTVELGLQTIHPQSLIQLNCCYTLKEFETALNALHARGVRTVIHAIMGLPWESERQMLETIKYIGKSGANGIKIHMLHVLRGTPLGNMYTKQPFPLLTEDEYIHLLGKALQLLPPNMEIHRLTGDGAKKDLIAPLWTANKRQVLNHINNYLKKL